MVPHARAPSAYDLTGASRRDSTLTVWAHDTSATLPTWRPPHTSPSNIVTPPAITGPRSGDPAHRQPRGRSPLIRAARSTASSPGAPPCSRPPVPARAPSATDPTGVSDASTPRPGPRHPAATPANSATAAYTLQTIRRPPAITAGQADSRPDPPAVAGRSMPIRAALSPSPVRLGRHRARCRGGAQMSPYSYDLTGASRRTYTLTRGVGPRHPRQHQPTPATAAYAHKPWRR